MTPDEFAQEYECSFEASVKGAVYARELMQAREQGRLTRVPYDPAVLVHTDWDFGFGDLTAIWFSQTLYSGEVRLIDYYEAKGQGIPHFVELLRSKGYTYGQHWAPHDIQLLEMSGNSRWQAAASSGCTSRSRHGWNTSKTASTRADVVAAVLVRCGQMPRWVGSAAQLPLESAERERSHGSAVAGA
jgi:hypothetical protein